MSSTSEVGHNKNAANFSAAIELLIEMGVLYQPPNTIIKLPSLTPIKAALATAINTLNDNVAINRVSVADRETAFKILDKRMTHVTNFFKSLNVDVKDKEIINEMVKKIRGDQKKKKTDPANPSKDKHSDSQQSYDSLIANLRKLIAQLSQFPEYLPNEADITIASLNTYADQLATLTNGVNQSNAALITARKDRNDILYLVQPSVINRVKDIKAYVKSIGEPALPYYKALVRLKFTDLKP